tara:strand:+ start:1243 stop:1854 length:612 start_codon:yes stop_codon:yes gene_type:complete
MSIRKIKTTISTIRGVYDENGNYLPSGNYYFEIKKYDDNGFSGKLPNFGNFCFSPKKLVKMMAVGQSRLADAANINDDGMPQYIFPTSQINGNIFQRVNRNVVIYQEEPECSICLDKIKNTDKKVLSCNHIFHRNCVDTWLRETPNCPLCRRNQSSSRPIVENDIQIEDFDDTDTLRNTTRRYREFNRGGSRTLIFPSRFSRN